MWVSKSIRKLSSREIQTRGIIGILLGGLLSLTFFLMPLGIGLFIGGAYLLSIAAKKKKEEDAEREANENAKHLENLKTMQEQTLKLEEIAKANRVVSTADEITKLAELKDKGIITNQEFEIKKKQFLDK